jgi:hypothetical protein
MISFIVLSLPYLLAHLVSPYLPCLPISPHPTPSPKNQPRIGFRAAKAYETPETDFRGIEGAAMSQLEYQRWLLFQPEK